MDSNASAPLALSVLPSGDTCDKCGSTDGVQKFDGGMLCKSCRNQWASMQ
jgi:hypothetical protein